MTYPDYIILAVLLIFFAKGAFRGFIGQVLSIAGWMAGIVLAWLFYPVVAVQVVKIGIPSVIAAIVSFILIYTAVIYTTKLLSKVLSKTAKMLLLGWLNRSLGAVFGLLEGILLIVIVLVLVSFTPIEKSVRSVLPKAPVVRMMKGLASLFTAELDNAGDNIKNKLKI